MRRDAASGLLLMPDRDRTAHVVIAGVTTRPLAMSAARAGYRVTAIDAFGDVDLRAVAEVLLARADRPGQAYSPMDAASAGSGVRAELAAYTSNFENHPTAVALLARGRRLLGNRPVILARVRDPGEVMRVLRRHGLATPESRSRAPEQATAARSWLLKPRQSGGGHGVLPWSAGDRVPRNMYLQERISGSPGSITFAADGVNAVLLGFSRQLVGERRLGAGPFRYCGSLLGTRKLHLFRRQDELLERASRLATVLTREFGLIGLNGVDFMAQDGVPYPIEVNPRYSASMELVERAHQVSMFAIHARACEGELPMEPRPCLAIHGKAIVFARRDTVTRSALRRLGRRWVADIPATGEHIPQGRPICTVFAQARQARACRELLIRRARLIYRAMKSATARVA